LNTVTIIDAKITINNPLTISGLVVQSSQVSFTSQAILKVSYLDVSNSTFYVNTKNLVVTENMTTFNTTFFVSDTTIITVDGCISLNNDTVFNVDASQASIGNSIILLKSQLNCLKIEGAITYKVNGLKCAPISQEIINTESLTLLLKLDSTCSSSTILVVIMLYLIILI